MRTWSTRSEALADELGATGALRSPHWKRAVVHVPRHVLVPTYYEYDGRSWHLVEATTAAGRERWLDRVYSNSALFTLPEGRSSSSMPSLMIRMLEALDIRDGDTVLEIGTGSGYNAALLCHRLGDRQVFSVDIEPDLVDSASMRLAELGFRPTLVVRDGAAGLAEHAPYDRLIATCSAPAVPWAWIEQTRSGGLVLLDLKIGTAGNLVLLRRFGDCAEGNFDARYGAFMPMRHRGVGTTSASRTDAQDRADVVRSRTVLDLPRPWEHPILWFLAHVQGAVAPADFGQRMDLETGRPGAAFIVDEGGSWCEIAAWPDAHGRREVWQGGPERIWDRVEVAHAWWVAHGRPGWERLGLTVRKQEQTVWLDSPSGPSWTLPIPSRYR